MGRDAGKGIPDQFRSGRTGREGGDRIIWYIRYLYLQPQDCAANSIYPGNARNKLWVWQCESIWKSRSKGDHKGIQKYECIWYRWFGRSIRKSNRTVTDHHVPWRIQCWWWTRRISKILRNSIPECEDERSSRKITEWAWRTGTWYL